MQEWNAWFRREQSKRGTIEDFARESGIDVRSVAAYRSDRIPRRAALAKIAAVLGDEGPIPAVTREQLLGIEERLARVEATLSGLDEVRLAREIREDAVRLLEAEEAELGSRVRGRRAGGDAPGNGG